MLKVLLSIIVAILILASTDLAQACGRGFFLIELNTKEPVRYKLFPVTPKGASYWDSETMKTIGEWFFPNENKERWFWKRPLKIEAATAERFLDVYSPDNYEPINNNLKSSGTSTDGTIRMLTAETHSAPFLMKLTSKNFVTDYYIGSFLGGCETLEKINLERKP